MMGSPFSRRQFGMGAAGLTLASVLAACTGANSNSDSTTGSGAGGGTLTLALADHPETFDPSQLISGGEQMLAWQPVYDTLLYLNQDGDIEPAAAEEWSYNDDRTELSLTLREGMAFSDGAPVNAEAVVNSLTHMRDGGGSDAVRLVGAEFTADDDRTVTVTVPAPRGLLETFLALAPGVIASPAIYESEDAASTPVGSGPYLLDASRTTPGSVWTYTKNPDHWNADAYVWETLVTHLMVDLTARYNALQSGQINGALLDPSLKTQAEEAGFTLLTHEPNWTGLIISDRNGEQIPALGNVKVRQAINHAFDREAIREQLHHGAGSPTNQIFNAQSEAYLPELEDMYPYDMEEAKRLMEESGEAPFEIALPSMADSSNNNAMITEQLGQLGITCREESISGFEGFMEILSGRFPIVDGSLESRSALWDIVQGVQPDATWNMAGAEDPELTKMCEAAQSLEGDEAYENFQEIGRWLVENAWFVPWLKEETVFACDDTVTTAPALGSVMPYLKNYETAE